MAELDLKEAIEILKDIVKNVSFRNAIQPNYEKEYLCRKAIFLAISKLSLLEQVEKGRAKKKREIISCSHGEMSFCDDCIDKNKIAIYFNEAIDLCLANFTNKMEKLDNFLQTASIWCKSCQLYHPIVKHFSNIEEIIASIIKIIEEL